MIRLLVSIMAATYCTGCVTFKPPLTTAPDRTAKGVEASFGKTWDAVIDVFAERNIPISTIDRSSGLIATAPLSVGVEGLRWADCGTEMGAPLIPESATYNVLVRSDSAAATVRVNVRWAPGPRALAGCVTKGVYESEMEEVIAAIAEGRAPIASANPRASAADLARQGAAVVGGSGATAYESPDSTSRVIGRLENGTVVVVLAAINEGWVAIQWGSIFDRRRGAVHVSDLVLGR